MFWRVLTSKRSKFTQLQWIMGGILLKWWMKASLITVSLLTLFENFQLRLKTSTVQIDPKTNMVLWNSVMGHCLN